MRVTTNNIFNTIDDLRRKCDPAKTISWDDISKAVTGAGMVIKNWMAVRGVLQYMLDQGMLKRTSDLHKEEYTCH